MITITIVFPQENFENYARYVLREREVESLLLERFPQLSNNDKCELITFDWANHLEELQQFCKEYPDVQLAVTVTLTSLITVNGACKL